MSNLCYDEFSSFDECFISFGIGSSDRFRFFGFQFGGFGTFGLGGSGSMGRRFDDLVRVCCLLPFLLLFDDVCLDTLCLLRRPVLLFFFVLLFLPFAVFAAVMALRGAHSIKAGEEPASNLQGLFQSFIRNVNAKTYFPEFR